MTKNSLIVILVFTTLLFSYPRRLIDMPTARTLKRGHYTFLTRMMPPGGSITGASLLFDMDFGVTDNFEVSLSYGGDGIVGRGDVDWYPWPGAHIKYKIFSEQKYSPAFTVGIDMQGFGGVAPEYRGFVYKSLGAYGVISKAYSGKRIGVSYHLLINYSFEDIKNVNWPNAIFSMNFKINSELNIMTEYDFAFNQLDINEEQGQYGRPYRGFLSLGITWNFLNNLGLQLNFRDIFQQRLGHYNNNGEDTPHGWGRGVALEYRSKF